MKKNSILILALFLSQPAFAATFVFNSIEGAFSQTVLIKGDGITCTGIILNQKQILTAAHCALNTKNRSPVVVFNAVDKNKKIIMTEIDSYIIHPLYKSQNQISYDIAKINLKDPIPSALSAKLQSRQVSQNTLSTFSETIYMLGYGLSPQALQSAATLQAETLTPKFAIKELNFKRDAIKYDKEIMIFSNKSARICSGDSGGPLLAADEASGQIYLLGLAVGLLNEKDTKKVSCSEQISFLNIESVFDWLK